MAIVAVVAAVAVLIAVAVAIAIARARRSGLRAVQHAAIQRHGAGERLDGVDDLDGVCHILPHDVNSAVGIFGQRKL